MAQADLHVARSRSPSIFIPFPKRRSKREPREGDSGKGTVSAEFRGLSISEE